MVTGTLEFWAEIKKFNQERKGIMVSPTDGMKPSWKGLKGAGGNTPVAEVVGLCSNWGIAPNQFGDNMITLNLSQCQILKSDSPFPYSELPLGIKYSESLNSGWGKFGQSVAEVFQCDIDALDIDLLVGQWLHLLRIDNVNFGTDSKTGQQFLGSVWKLVELVQAGAPVVAIHPSLVNPQPAAAAIAAVVSGQVANPGVPIVAPVPPVIAPPPVVAAPMAQASVAAAPATTSQDPTTRALDLLHGSDLATFFQKALPDPVLKADPMLINSIINQTFIAAKITSGEVILNEDGTHSVVGR